MPNKEVTIWSLINLSNNLQITILFIQKNPLPFLMTSSTLLQVVY